MAGGLLGAVGGFFITRRIVGPTQSAQSSLTRRIGWIAVGMVSLSAIAFFYVIETRVRSYRISEATNKSVSPAIISFDFGTPEVRRILGAGWSLDELWQDGKQSVVWAEGVRSEMSALFPTAAGYRWRLNLYPYTGRGPACQVVEVRVNKISVVKMLLEQGWHWYEFDVSKGVIRSGNNHVQFLFSFSESPKSHGRSADTRRLSVAFDILEATPQS